ncbi:MAG: hypothetical protein ACR2HR_05475 [Euzebya sp.]
MTPHDPQADDLERDAVQRYRGRLGHAPPAITDSAVAAFRSQRAAHRAWTLARVLLVVAGIAGLVLDLPVVLGSATHTTQDVAVLHVALAAGLLVAAWRPDRYARGLAPVAVIAAALLVLPSATGVGAATISPLAEAGHLPVIAGAAALLLGPWGVLRRRSAA